MAIQIHNEREAVRPIRGDRVLSRTIYRKRGTPIHSHSLSSFDGIPIGVERGAEIEAEWGDQATRRGRSGQVKFVRKYPISIAYFAILFLVGIILQVWTPWT